MVCRTNPVRDLVILDRTMLAVTLVEFAASVRATGATRSRDSRERADLSEFSVALKAEVRAAREVANLLFPRKQNDLPPAWFDFFNDVLDDEIVPSEIAASSDSGGENPKVLSRSTD